MKAAVAGAARVGWVPAPSPIHATPKLADELGLAWLGFKRDDLIEALHGGSKVRKLDYLLATPRYAEAPGWAAWGATGSGQLVALVAAAQQLDRRVLACMFWEPADDHVLQNLAFTASGPTEIRFRAGRIGLAARNLGVIRGTTVAGLPAVPPGATCGPGMLGTVEAGLELADQIRAGELPEPDRIVVALGSGGTAAGLAVGLGMAGLRPTIHAVATVERIFMSDRGLAASIRQAQQAAETQAEPAPIEVDRRWLGAGYGRTSPASAAACARLAAQGPPGLGLEGVYTGKAMAWLLAEPPAGEKVLFWQTARRPGALPAADDWCERLPAALRTRLGVDNDRRRVLVAGAALIATGAGVGVTLTGTPPREVLCAAAEALLPPLRLDHDEVAARALAYLEQTGQGRRASVALGLVELGAPLTAGRFGRLSSLPREDRAEVLAALDARGGLSRRLYRAVRDLVMVGAYQQDAAWVGTGYGGPWVRPSDPPRPDPYAALASPVPAGIAELNADLCVVGSGPGGAAAAAMAAEAGLSTIILEAGELVTPAQVTQREEQMLPRLFWQAGARATSDGGVRIHQGKGVGGSSLHNLNLCKRLPVELQRAWALERGLQRLTPERWSSLFDEVESLLRVSEVPDDRVSRHNALLDDARRKLGWAGGRLRHNRSGCKASGFCALGCAYDAKNNALKVFITRAVTAGALLLPRTQAVRVLHAGGRAVGVEAIGPDGRRLIVRSPRICLAASATGTAALLLRSDIPAPAGAVGDTLRIHPAAVACARMPSEVRAWEGIPQSIEVTEFEGRGVWLVPVFAHPMSFAALCPGQGKAHRTIMAGYDHLAAVTAMVHDTGAGQVRPDGDLGLRITYEPTPADRAALKFGLERATELLVAAGGVPLDAGGLADLTAVHPVGTVPMGADPAVAAVGDDGAHHQLGGLWVSDGSLMPSAPGVPPQITIYALGMHVGRAIAATA